MNKLESLFLAATKPSKDDDFAARLVYRYTVFILILFALVIFGWSFFGTPIQCWFPVQFTAFWNEYALDYCYVQNTYFQPLTDDTQVTHNDDGRSGAFELLFSGNNNNGHTKNHWWYNKESKNAHKENTIISYYQWVPFVFALMAMCFYLPSTVWRRYYETVGVAKAVFNQLESAADTVDDSARKKCANLIGYLLCFQISNCAQDDSKCFRYFTSQKTFAVYLCIKLMYSLICVGQWFWLKHFLGLEKFWWGVDVFSDIYNNREWTETGHFPRVTFCDFKVRELANIQNHKIQCVLLINMLNEKLFLFLWFWFALTTLLTSLSSVYWIMYGIFCSGIRGNILLYLNAIDPLTKNCHSRNYHMARQMTKVSVTCDCLFLLHVIEKNSGDKLCCEVIESLWNNYKKQNAYQFDDMPEIPVPKTLRTSLPIEKVDEPVDDSTLPSRARLVHFKEAD